MREKTTYVKSLIELWRLNS